MKEENKKRQQENKQYPSDGLFYQYKKRKIEQKKDREAALKKLRNGYNL